MLISVLGALLLMGAASSWREVVRYAEMIMKSGTSLLSIINDILDFSKIKVGRMDVEKVRVEPAAVVEDVLSLFWERAACRDVDLAGFVSRDVPLAIEGDPVRLNQVLSNLVNNALKFTETGHVFVTVKRLAGDKGQTFEFAVHDTGIGIPEDKIGKVFESFSRADQFTTRKYGGTGLGLPIRKKLVEAMGGQIGAGSVPGQGSVFKFHLTPVIIEGAGGDKNSDSLIGKRVIVAIDGGASMGVVANCLRERGIEVDIRNTEAGLNGPIAVDYVIAEPELLKGMCPASQHQIFVAVSQLGDFAADTMISAGAVQDLMMRPVTTSACREMLDAVLSGKPRGKSLLESRSAPSDDLPSFADKRVLVADDSAVNREVVVQALQRLQIIPDLVKDGVQALHAAKLTRYDIILMDGSMPVMDGFETSRAIRDYEADNHMDPVPIVALTAHVAGRDADARKHAGMDDCVTKPFTMAILSRCCVTWCGPGDAKHSVAELEGATVGSHSGEKPETEALDAPALDPTVLADIAEMGGSAQLLHKIFDLFKSNAPDGISAIKTAIDAGDRMAIASPTHALKSMSANTGATALAGICAQLEKRAPELSMRDAKQILADIDGETERVSAAMDDEESVNAALGSAAAA